MRSFSLWQPILVSDFVWRQEFCVKAGSGRRGFDTGYCDRLKAPHGRLSFRETPVIAGTLLGVGFILLQVLAFFALRHFLAK